MNETMDQMRLDAIVSTSSGKTARELEIELHDVKVLIRQEKKILEQEKEVTRLLREKAERQIAEVEKEKKELYAKAAKFDLESKQALKSLNSAIQGYKDALVAAASDDDYLQYCKTIQFDDKHTAYDYIVRLKKMYRQHEADRQDRLIALEAKARQQRSAAMASANRIMSDENPRRLTPFYFGDEEDPRLGDPNLEI